MVTTSLFSFCLVTGFGGGDYANDYFEYNYTDDSSRKIVILSSVPSGSPLNVDDIRCQLLNCSGFGRRFHPIHREVRKHEGVDLSAKMGTPILSTSHGIVESVDVKRYGYGKCVRVVSEDYLTLYAHMSKILVKEGQRVALGDTLGLVGTSGTSTAPHCHYEVRRKVGSGGQFEAVDPIPFILNRNTTEK